MSQFEKNYSNIYNLIYKKKNYKKEFLNIQRSLPKKIPLVKDIELRFGYPKRGDTTYSRGEIT